MVPRVLELRERLEQAEILRAIAEARAAELAAVAAELAPAVAAAAAQGFSYNTLTSLEKEGFIKGFSINSNKKLIKVFFRYNKIDTTFIKKIKCISKPSNRIYFSTKNLTKLDFNTGTFLLSTSKGVISHTSALKKSVGGDVLCFLSQE